jgi:hypothetical protein
VTGQHWSPADLNVGLEFGFTTGSVANETPRLSNAAVRITYRLPATSSTIYIGGVYEANRDGSGAITGATKYYAAVGQTVAIRPDWSGRWRRH